MWALNILGLLADRDQELEDEEEEEEEEKEESRRLRRDFLTVWKPSSFVFEGPGLGIDSPAVFFRGAMVVREVTVVAALETVTVVVAGLEMAIVVVVFVEVALTAAYDTLAIAAVVAATADLVVRCLEGDFERPMLV